MISFGLGLVKARNTVCFPDGLRFDYRFFLSVAVYRDFAGIPSANARNADHRGNHSTFDHPDLRGHLKNYQTKKPRLFDYLNWDLRRCL